MKKHFNSMNYLVVLNDNVVENRSAAIKSHKANGIKELVVLPLYIFKDAYDKHMAIRAKLEEDMDAMISQHEKLTRINYEITK